MSITEVSARSGLTPQTLRYYEREGLLPPPERDAGGRRRYADSVIDHLTVVTALRQSGFGVREVAAFLSRARGGATVGDRLDSAEGALDELDGVLDARAAALRRARGVVRRWRAEVTAARSDLDPAQRLTCADDEGGVRAVGDPGGPS